MRARSAVAALTRLLCVLLAAAAAAAVCPPAGASLPRQRNKWPSLATTPRPWPPVCVPDAAAPHGRACVKPWQTQSGSQPLRERFFSSALTRAAVATRWPDALRPLLARLRAGAPITALAFGSSIVEHHAGCFASRAAVDAAGVGITPPFLNATLQASPTQSCATPGFASEFFAAVNATWPHPRHVFLNAGRSAAALNAFASYLCTDPWLPTNSSVDLLLLETHVVDAHPEEAAQLVRDVERVYNNVAHKVPRGAGGALPVVVLLNFFPLTDKATARGERCMGGFGTACAACGANASALQERLAVAFPLFTSAQDAIAAAARRYGWAAISMRDAMLAGLRDGAHTALGWSACEWLNGFMSDRVHPSPQGARLMADALISLLVEAQDAEKAACGDADGDDNSTAAELPTVALSRWAPMTPGAFSAPLRLCNDAGSLAVHVSEGWQHVQTEQVKGHTVHKPGWIATEPGAVLEFTVSTHFLDGEAGDAANATLAVTHLVSYEHMGAAWLSCASGCACDGALLQGHTTEHVSIEHTVELNVTQAAACALRLTVREESLSGEHKVKLIGIAANGPHGGALSQSAAAPNATGY